MISPKIEEFVQALGRNQGCCLKCTATDSYIGLRYYAEESSVLMVVSAGSQRSADLTPEAQQWLFDKGFRRKRMSENFEKSFKEEVVSTQFIEQMVRDIFERCFGNPPSRCDLIELPPLESDDSHVLEAMNLLSTKRDWNARKTLYRMLIDTWFVFPVDESGEPLVEDKIASWPVCATFTSYRAFFRHHPIGVTCQVVKGSELFSKLVTRKFGSLRINPGSDTRGELYFNELEMLKDAAEKLAKHYAGRR